MNVTQVKQAADTLSVHHDNEASIREGFAAFAAGDLDAVKAKCSPDIVWVSPGSGSLSGTYTGWDEVQGFFLAGFERSGGTLSIKLLDVVANDTRACAITDMTATIDGETKTFRGALVYELQDGLATSVIELPYDYEAANAFWN